MHALDAAGRGTAYKTAPVTRVPVHAPEYADVHGIYQLFGIKRSLLYALMKEGAVKSVSLAKKGERCGKRLIDVASVREFLKAH